jgi:hypothetical protein
MALQFEQVAGTALFEVVAPDSVGWAGYVVPSLTGVPAQIPIGDTLTRYGGSYLFAYARPPAAATDPGKLADDANAYVKKYSRTGRAAVWLKGVGPVEFGPFEAFAFAFNYDAINRNYPLRTNLNVVLGSNLSFFVLQGLLLTVDEAAGALRVGKTKAPTANFIGFQNGSSSVGINVQEGTQERARVPFAGPSAGCFTFQATMAPAVTFAPPKGMLAGFRYAARSTTDVTLAYPAFQLSALPSSLPCAGTVDPGDPTNTRIAQASLLTGHLRTGFTLAGAPELASTFRTAEGIAVSLVPLGTGGGATAPPPGPGGSRWRRWRAPPPRRCSRRCTWRPRGASRPR